MNLEELFIINHLLNKALEISNHKPERCIIFQREKDKADLDQKIDIDWEDAHKNAKPYRL